MQAAVRHFHQLKLEFSAALSHCKLAGDALMCAERERPMFDLTAVNRTDCWRRSRNAGMLSFGVDLSKCQLYAQSRSDTGNQLLCTVIAMDSSHMLQQHQFTADYSEVEVCMGIRMNGFPIEPWESHGND